MCEELIDKLFQLVGDLFLLRKMSVWLPRSSGTLAAPLKGIYSRLNFQDGRKYGELFAYALRTFGILAIGLYRFRDSTSTITLNPCAKRYVITNPPDDLPLLSSDKVKSFFTIRRLDIPNCCTVSEMVI